MKWTEYEIKKLLGDKLIGNTRMKEITIRSLLLLPDQLIENVCRTVWFISSPEDSWAFTFKGTEIRNRFLVFLSDELLREPEKQIRYTILHEVGHVVLNHRNSIGYHQTQLEIMQQEKEADEFVKDILEKVM